MARGINVGASILTTTLDGVPLSDVWAEYQATLAEWNASRSPITALFTQSTSDSGKAVSQSAEGDDFEEASEFGVPKSTRPEVEPLVLGFPLGWYDMAIRYTETFLRDATAGEVNAQHSNVLEADNRFLFRSVMKALFTKTALANRKVNENGATIYGLWDGEADATPPSFAGQSFIAGHSHYLVSGAATVDGADLRDLTNTITEHGYGLAGNWGVAILVNPAQGDAIRGFRADPSNPTTKPFDFIPAQNAPAYISDENIIGDRPAGEFNGLTVIGSYGRALIVEDHYVPADYLAAVATDTKPLAFRQHVRAEYQGLRLIPGRTSAETPIIDSRYNRGFGLGVQYRGAAAVMKIAATGPYSAPSGL